MTAVNWLLAILSAAACAWWGYRWWANGTEPARTAARMRELLGHEKIEPDDHAKVIIHEQ